MGNELSKRNTSGSHFDKEVAVLKANSNLSEQEIREMYDEFNYEAESGIGRMDKKQFRKYYKKVTNIDDENGILADNAFAVFDTNHDGSIDFSEFVLAATIENKNDPDSQFDLAFAMVDTSGDERISYDEVVNFVEKALKLVGEGDIERIDPKMVASDIYKMFSLDKGQKLNKQQFIDGCKKNNRLAQIFGIL